MKTKKMLLYILSVVLLVIMIMGSLGVATWALLSTKLDVSGKIGFTGTGDVKATISQGTVTGGTVTQNEGKSPMQQVTITEDGASDSSSWTKLELDFADNANQFVISFSVTNNHTDKNLEINVGAFTATDNNITVAVTAEGFGATNPVVIAPQTAANYDITFTVGETNSKLERGFELMYNLVNTEAAASVPAPEPTWDKLSFSLIAANNAYSVRMKDSTIAGEVVLPTEYRGLPVTSIANEAFRSCRGLTSITIPESITIIGESAFYSCKALNSITIPESVTSIGKSAFQDCMALQSITIPSNVTSIGAYAFCECSGLTEISIPVGVTSIGDCAFLYCSRLTSITIPEGVTSIGDGAFMYCGSLSTINFENTSGEITIGLDVFDSQTSYEPISVKFAAKWTDGTNNYEAGTHNIDVTILNGKTWRIG